MHCSFRALPGFIITVYQGVRGQSFSSKGTETRSSGQLAFYVGKYYLSKYWLLIGPHLKGYSLLKRVLLLVNISDCQCLLVHLAG